MIRAALMAMLTSQHHDQTRSVEFMLAWLMVGWGVVVLLPGDIIVGPTSAFLLYLMSEPVWGVVAVTIGSARLVALVINGAWQRSPLLRFAGAAIGLMWWTSQGAIYWIAVANGGLPFPNLSIYPVFVFFEAYSCYRCGQDANALHSLGRHRVSQSETGGNG